jgi:hypothetical protein
MSRWTWRSAAVLMLTPLLLDGAVRAQWPPALSPPPAVPAAPAVLEEPLAECVPRQGDAGCAARLYAQVLCALVGRGPERAVARWQTWLQRRYEQAGIRFEGLTAEQIEQRALEEQVPQLCPASTEAIRSLFSTPAPP